MAEATQSADYVAKAKGDEPPRCDHICRLDEGHVERGEVHQYGYELPSPRQAQSYQDGYEAGFADGMECVCDEVETKHCPVHGVLDCHINQAGDTYDVICSCGWKALDCGDLESAGELRRLHLGDDHDE